MKGGLSRVEIAQLLLRVRALRWDFFRGDLFDEYAWNILLVLYIAQENGHDTTETMALQEASVPPAVGTRWIAHLEQSRLVDRDGPPDILRLTDASRAQLADYLDEVALVLAA